MLEIINYNTAPVLQVRNATYPFAVVNVATVTALRTTEPSYAGQVIMLLGHTTAGIGGGNFRYDATDTTTADDNGLTIVTSGGKRWKRILDDNGVISVDQFGDTSNSTVDHSAIVQAAIDYAGITDKAISFTSGRIYNLSGVQLKPKSPTNWNSQAGSNPWRIYGNGCIIVNGATSTTETPSLYYSGLTPAIGGSAAYGEFGLGVFIYDVVFRSTSGFGIGYKHVRAGNLNINGCEFLNHEVGVKLLGTGGCGFRDSKFSPKSNTGKGIWCAKLPADSYSVNYTREEDGWNDGIHVDKCSFGGGGVGFEYDGSTAESVVTIKHCILTSQKESAIYVKSPCANFLLESSWFEFHDDPNCKIIRITAETKSGGLFESEGTFKIKNCYISGYNGTFDYMVHNTGSRSLIFTENKIQLNSGTVYNGVIWSNVGAGGSFNDAQTLTPTRTTNLNSQGKISFANSDLTLGKNNVYYMQDGTNKFLLRPTTENAPSGSTEFTLYKYTNVYSPQWAYVGANWLHNISPVSRTNPTGIVVDFNTPHIGYTWSGNPVTLTHGFDGNGMTSSPTCYITHNTLLGVDESRFYSQREFGKVIMYDNREE